MRCRTEPHPAYTFEADMPGPHLLISAGVHGDEFEPMLTARELIRQMESILTKGTVIIVPVVNRTAFSLGTRFGSDGLDLARICPGNSLGSASEADAAAISRYICEADYYIDLHTGGAAFSIFPLAGYMLHASAEVLEKQRNMARAFHLPVIWGTESTPAGRTLSVARDASVPAIYVEYGGGSAVSNDIITAYHQGCLQVMASLGMTSEVFENNYTPTYWVEDDRPDSGYLQAKLPAPEEGIFVPARGLGTIVQKDDLLGNIINPLLGTGTQVLADSAGLLFFQRASSFVKRGDALGGILPVAGCRERVYLS